MQFTDTGKQLFGILANNVSEETKNWLQEKLNEIITSESTKDLYLTYSLLSGKIEASKPLKITQNDPWINSYLKAHGATILEIARIYFLVKVLEENGSYFSPKVANLIEVADTSELETFLRYLILLPNAEDFKHAAVEALRTNIATVFDAISLGNPYPSKYFNDQQWNQMYLKAAFMQRNLAEIMEVDKKANKDLARIISDYAHERWAASRDVDPLFWRPVSSFLEGVLLEDMHRLLNSDNEYENRAGALCCYYSQQSEANELLEKYNELREKVKSKTITWKNLKD